MTDPLFDCLRRLHERAAPTLSDQAVRLEHVHLLDEENHSARGFRANAPCRLAVALRFLSSPPPPITLVVQITDHRGHRRATLRHAVTQTPNADAWLALSIPIGLSARPGHYYISLHVMDGEGRGHALAEPALELIILPGDGDEDGAFTFGPPVARMMAASPMKERAAGPLFPEPLQPAQDDSHEPPILIHLSHYKAGTQWIRRILHFATESLEAPLPIHEPWPMPQNRARPRAYSTLYLTEPEYRAIGPRPHWRPFFVLRDLRDTLTSAYFSLLYSHPSEAFEEIRIDRTWLERLGLEEGFIHLMEGSFCRSADIQWSWLTRPHDVTMLRYEDLLTRDEELLVPIIASALPELPSERIREAVRKSRFEAMTGRAPGQEDRAHHARKGIQGDWRNHFTPKITALFKHYFGELLIAGGYEKNKDWS